MAPFRKTLLLLAALFVYAKSDAQRFTRVDSFRVGAYGAAAWGDYDGDGRADLAYGAQTMQAGQPDFLTIYHNTPNGLVALPLALPYMPLPQLCWADLDNNGTDELVVSGLDSNGSATRVYQYNGSTLVPLPGVNLPGYQSGYTAAADYNGDGWIDLAMTGYDSNLQLTGTILKGGPGLTFTPVASIMGAVSGEIKWGDYDGDGKPDLLMNGYALNTHSSRVWIYKNMGTDSFQLQPNNFPGMAGTVDWLDYDGDGKLDILATGVDTSSVRNRTDLYHNNGNGTFSAVITNLPEFGEPSAVAVGDFNRDGKPDLALAGGNPVNFDFAMLAYGTGTGQFVLDSLYPADVTNCIAETADFDGDGYPDLLLSGNLLRNQGAAAAVINFPETDNALRLYPNPVGETPLQLEWQAAVSGPETLTVCNAAGVVVRREKIFQQKGKNRWETSAKDLSAGVYLVQIGASEAVQFVKH